MVCENIALSNKHIIIFYELSVFFLVVTFFCGVLVVVVVPAVFRFVINNVKVL